MPQVDPEEILNLLANDMAFMWGQAFRAWVFVAALQIMYGAIAYLFWDKVLWSCFSYPIVGLVLLQAYPEITRALVQIPDSLGSGFADAAFQNVLADIQTKSTQWGSMGGFLSLLKETVWSFIMKGLMICCTSLSLIIFAFVRLAQIAAVGCLYVIGPFACLAASFAPTSRWAGKWAVMCVECGTWTLIWSVLLKAAVTLGKKIEASVPDWNDPASFGKAFQGIAVMFLYAALSLMTPVFARILIGGGFGVAVGAAAAAMAKSATTAGASTAAGAIVGGASGGPAGAVGGAAIGALSSAGVRGLPSPSSMGKKAA